MGMRLSILTSTLLAAIVMAGLIAVFSPIAMAVPGKAVSVSTRLFLGRVNNWMIWEYEGNEGRFCFITSSPEGTSPLRHPSLELWVTQRPLQKHDGGKDYAFEISLTAEGSARQQGAAKLRVNVGDQKHIMALINDRFWLQAEPKAVEKLLQAMLHLEAIYEKKKRRDPRSEPAIPMIDVRSLGEISSIAAHFSLLGLTKAKAAIDDHCPQSATRA